MIVEEQADTVLITAEAVRPNPMYEQDPLKKLIQLYQFRGAELMQTVSNVRGLSRLTKLGTYRGWFIGFCDGMRFLSDDGRLDPSFFIPFTKKGVASSPEKLKKLRCLETAH